MANSVPARLTAAQGRRFALTVGGAFLVVGGVFFWRGVLAGAWIGGAIGGLLVLAGLVAPTAMGPVERAWMGLAHAISKVTTPIVMGILFFVVITPLGLLRRLAGKGALHRVRGAPTAWTSRPAGSRRSNLSRQF